MQQRSGGDKARPRGRGVGNATFDEVIHRPPVGTVELPSTRRKRNLGEVGLVYSH